MVFSPRGHKSPHVPGNRACRGGAGGAELRHPCPAGFIDLNSRVAEILRERRGNKETQRKREGTLNWKLGC